jgi:hypothetical protein
MEYSCGVVPARVTSKGYINFRVLKGIVNAPWYARNSDIHGDLGIRMVTAEIKRLVKKHEDRLHQHTNVEVTQLLDNERTVRRLKRLKPLELV